LSEKPDPKIKKIIADSDMKWDKPSSPIAKKLLDDFISQRKIKLPEIVEMKISELEKDTMLKEKYPEEVKKLRSQWNAFLEVFIKLGKYQKNHGKKQ